MGYLGAQQRRSDPAAGLVQMGVRPYSPALGAFIAEDPVLGHLGFSITLNRYAYVWNNPLLYFDLNGRSIFDPAVDAMGDAWNATGGAAWDADGRSMIGVAGDGNGGWAGDAGGFLSERAQDFIKEINFSTEELIAGGASSLGTAGLCGLAVIGASTVGTPASGAAAALLCTTLQATSIAETANDIMDDENGLLTDEFIK